MVFPYPKNRDYKIGPNGINELKTITLGGTSQTILIQSENPHNPVLLFLHGGPSMPIPGTSSRGADYVLITCTKNLVKHFTVVYWDQKGTGKSYSKSIPKETMHLKQFIKDASELTDYLRRRFNQTKIHILGHSWGTIIGLSLAYEYPEKYYSYTAFSQMVNWTENDKLCYQWVLERARNSKNKKAIKELTDVGEPPYLESFKQWSILRKWQFKYKSLSYDAGDKGSATFYKGLRIMLKSPDYSLSDVFNSLVFGLNLSYTEQMMDDINHLNFLRNITKIDIPIFFIHGEKETHIMPELVVSYFDSLDAPKGKKFFWSKNSSHIFHMDDAIENEQLLISNLLSIKE